MKLSTFDLVILIGTVAGLAAFFVVSSNQPKPPANENSPLSQAPGSAATAVSLEPNPTPTNASPTYLPSNTDLVGPEPSNGLLNTNQNITTTRPKLTVLEVTAAAARYNGRPVCLAGFYQNSFEFTAFGTNRPPSAIAPPYIWTEIEIPITLLVCEQTGEGERTCTGEVTACGIFEYSPEPTFGHVGAYQYRLR